MQKTTNKAGYSVKEVAAILDCTQPTISYHIKYGHLRATRVGERVWLIDRESVASFIKTRSERVRYIEQRWAAAE